MIEIRYCDAADILLDDTDSLIAEYSVESSLKGMPPTSAQLEAYEAMEEAGSFQCIGAFDGDRLIGFATVMISLMPHYNALTAVTESIFVAKEYRKNGTGLKLLKAVEHYCEMMGAVGLLMTAPVGGSLAKVLPRTGFTNTNLVFFKGFERE